MKKFFKIPANGKARTAIFLSGSGTNAKKILEFWKNNPEQANFTPSCIVTDRPERCAARKIASTFELPIIELDIFDFYKKRGLLNISLASDEGRKAREAWTNELINKLSPYSLEFGIFAGFVPLCNITESLPCLNVHPGDLSVLDEKGHRVLTGLHAIPIEQAIIRDIDHMRTSVIIASVFSSNGAGMDEGIIIGLSPEVDIDLENKSVEFYKGMKAQRAGKVSDQLRDVALKNQDKLKKAGDWTVFPPAVNDFAAGIFAYDDNMQLYIETNGTYIPIQHIEYDTNEKEIIFP